LAVVVAAEAEAVVQAVKLLVLAEAEALEVALVGLWELMQEVEAVLLEILVQAVLVEATTEMEAQLAVAVRLTVLVAEGEGYFRELVEQLQTAVVATLVVLAVQLTVLVLVPCLQQVLYIQAVAVEDGAQAVALDGIHLVVALVVMLLL
jgi:hypothetical protein